MPTLLAAAARAWLADRAPTLGAALASCTLFSMAPVLLIAIAVAGAVFDVDTARTEMLGRLQSLLGAEGAAAVAAWLDNTQRSGQPGWAMAIGVLLLLVGATTVFAELQDSLDHIWRVDAPRNGGSLWQLMRTRLLSFGLALFAAICEWMPKARIGWHGVILGSLLTAMLFTIGKAAIGCIGTQRVVAAGFGAASAIVGTMVWIYAAVQVFLYGAELTRLLSQRRTRLMAQEATGPQSQPDQATSISSADGSRKPGKSSVQTS